MRSARLLADDIEIFVGKVHEIGFSGKALEAIGVLQIAHLDLALLNVAAIKVALLGDMAQLARTFDKIDHTLLSRKAKQKDTRHDNEGVEKVGREKMT